MSRLVENLKRSAESAVPAMGFRAASAADKVPKLLLVVGLTRPDVSTARELVESGADALLVHATDSKALAEVAQAAGKAPCGVVLKETSNAQLSALKKSGCDFVVFSPGSSPVSWLQEEGMGKVLRVPSSADMASLRGLDRLPIDVVLVDQGDEQEFISVQFLMACYFLRDALRKPLLAAVPTRVSTGDVRALWEAGVDGLVVEALGDKVRELRQAADGLPVRAGRRGVKEVPVLPRLEVAALSEAEEEEEQ
ncbi:MAG: hypothetical protein AB1603_04520 [Chloroflexota bacterium]